MAQTKSTYSAAPSYLQKHPLFEGWSDVELGLFYEQCDRIEFAEQEYLFQRDQGCVAFYIVETGAVQMQWQTDTAQVRPLHYRTTGGAVGDACVLMGDTYRVDAIALEPTIAIRITKQHFYAQLAKHPWLMMRLVSSLSQNLCYLFGDVMTMQSVSGTQRVIHYLLDRIALKNQQRIELDRSKAHIAAALNLTPEHFSRILNDLIKKEFIEVAGRQVVIKDVDGLLCYRR
ncbi:Crp/Fnr family transcriptional regulator [Paenalcaligenes hominis]|uniref:Crp/Fnr family transcriptional regulator n=1 Tax=Paenalcaligenes hominis TaxID=643674 RepID=UPI0035258C72